MNVVAASFRDDPEMLFATPNIVAERRADGSIWLRSMTLLLAEPASVDGGEITDKGYVNQRAVLTRRAVAVAMLEDDACTEWIGCPD